MGKKIGIGAEGLIHKDFAKQITQYETYNQHNWDFWSYSASGEKRNAITGSLLKAKGLKTGQPDYVFYYTRDNITCLFFIEFKANKNKQSDTQIIFEKQVCKNANTYYFVCYSVEEAIIKLTEYNLLKI